MNDKLINSFRIAMTERWMTEIGNRTINKYMDEVRMCKCLHSLDRALDLDVSNWMKINDLRHYIMKDTYTTKSLFTRIKTALAKNNLQVASDLSLELDEKMSLLRTLYSNYKKNLLDI